MGKNSLLITELLIQLLRVSYSGISVLSYYNLICLLYLRLDLYLSMWVTVLTFMNTDLH